MPETEVDIDEHESLSFTLPHNSVLWTSTLPKLKLYSTSMTLSSIDTLCKPWCPMWLWADYMQRLKPTAGLKIMIPIYETTYSSDFISDPQKKHFKMTSQMLARCFHMLLCLQFIFLAELYGSMWQDEKVATAYGCGGINKETKLIIIKWRQIPPDFTHWLPTRKPVPRFFPRRIKIMCGTYKVKLPSAVGHVIWLLKLYLNIRKVLMEQEKQFHDSSSSSGVKLYSWGQGQVSFSLFFTLRASWRAEAQMLNMRINNRHFSDSL